MLKYLFIILINLSGCADKKVFYIYSSIDECLLDIQSKTKLNPKPMQVENNNLVRGYLGRTYLTFECKRNDNDYIEGFYESFK